MIKFEFFFVLEFEVFEFILRWWCCDGDADDVISLLGNGWDGNVVSDLNDNDLFILKGKCEKNK